MKLRCVRGSMKPAKSGSRLEARVALGVREHVDQQRHARLEIRLQPHALEHGAQQLEALRDLDRIRCG